MTKINLNEYIKENTIRLDVSRRGGGIEIDASGYLKIDGAKMTAYQNYLGGGMLGSIQSARNFETQNKAKNTKADNLAEALKKYFHEITNADVEDYDEWSAGDYESIQGRPSSAY